MKETKGWYTQIVDMANNCKTVRITMFETKELAFDAAKYEMRGWMEDDDELLERDARNGRYFFEVRTPSGYVDFVAVVGEVKLEK